MIHSDQDMLEIQKKAIIIVIEDQIQVKVYMTL